jgi:hypothetical protein
MSLLLVLQQHGISTTWATEGKLSHGLRGFRKLQAFEVVEEIPQDDVNIEVVEEIAQDDENTDSEYGVALGGAFGNGFATASVSSTGDQVGFASGSGRTQGYSNSFVEKPSGDVTSETESSGSGNALAKAKVTAADKNTTSSSSDVQNSGFGLSVSVTGDDETIDSFDLDSAVEALTAETSKDIPFFELFGGSGTFGGFGAIFDVDGPGPDDSTSSASTPDIDASIFDVDGPGPDDSSSSASTPEDDASGGGTGATNTVEVDSDETADTVENTDEESAPVTSQPRSTAGGFYGSFGSGP